MYSSLRTALLGASLLGGFASAALAAPLITSPIDDSVTVAVTGERSPLLSRTTDLGALPESHVLPHVRLALKRPAALQKAFDKLVHDQLDPKSPSYHQWLKPSDLRSYGPDQADINKVVAWLQSHGLTVNHVSPSGMSIDFAGPATVVGAAFHTSLHSVSLNGETHIANTTDLAIPAALSAVVRGATLSNFFPKPNMVRSSPNFTIPDGDGYILAVGPADFAKIYNVAPLYTGEGSMGYVATGAGVTIAVVEQTKIAPKDWNKFRREFKLDGYQGTLTLTHPGDCGDPGFTGDEGEAALDAEWSSAVAVDASIIEASCPETETTFGVETTLESLVEIGTEASTLSISYGGSEQANGLTFLDGWANLVEEGASEGLSIMISAGDSGAAAEEEDFVDGLGVNGLSTNPYNTTLGGTDFYDTATNTNGTYWSLKNGPGLESAKSYIPEIPWNNSCSSNVVSKYLGFQNVYVSCNSSSGNFVEQDGIGGTGGQSIYYAKPDWQNIGVPGMPNDGVRDQPDVSLFAANGIWGHFYVFCMSNENTGGAPCSTKNINGNAAGGTSFAAPIFAGVMALVAEFKGYKLGNTAPRLYQLALQQYQDPLLLSRCNSTLGNKISTACVFNDVTVGNNAQPCITGTVDCRSTKASTEGVGIMTAPGAPTVPAFTSTQGYDLATGLGTVNVTNLLINY
jgi:subtilase family serine protease